MPVALHSFKVDDDGEVRICHTFYGKNSAQALQAQRDHAKDCPHYGPALKKGDTIDIEEEIDLMPMADEEELVDFLGLNDEEEDDEDEG